MTLQKEQPKKDERYRLLIRDMKNLYNPALSKAANVCQVLAIMKHQLNLFWVGIYEVKGDKLLLGIFQGDVACQEIKPGSGACGTAAITQEIVNIKDVYSHDNYISCHTETQSEIVVPAVQNGKTRFVLDVDSEKPAEFDEKDEKYLAEIVQYLMKIYSENEGN